jgi:tetratricopeptide (TPR) repeat protein
MEQLYRDYPNDHEAAAFYALSLVAIEPPTLANRKAAADILEKLFSVEPDHPGAAHYLIHAYDTPELAQLGLAAARRYAQIAPSAPHAVHMPSHIFARLGLWQEDISSNLDSIAAARRGGALHMGDEGQQFHAIDFLAYAYLQSGRESEVPPLIQEMKALPETKDMYVIGYDPRISAIIELSAMYALELHHWSEAASLIPIPVKTGADDSITYWARAIGAARSGNLIQAREDIEKIDTIHKAMLAEKKADWAVDVDQDHKEASAWLAHAEGRNDEGIAQLRPIADKEEGEFEVSEGIPAREMLGDILMEMNRPEEALAEYEADLKVNPNRFNAVYGAARAAELAGAREKAARYYSQLVKDCSDGNSNRPELNLARSFTESRN